MKIFEGINGRGERVFLVVTVGTKGHWKHVERFDTEAEAKNWKRWA